MGASWTPPPEVIEEQRRDARPRHWTRDVLILTAWGSFLALLVFVIVTVISTVMVRVMTPETENTLFGSTYDEVASEMTSDEEAYAVYLQDIVDRLSSHWEACPYDLRVAVMHEASPNAMAVPGGTILVTTGLLEMATSENELAFVLGHELGHFKHRHQLKRIGRTLSIAIVASLLIDRGAVLLPAATRLGSRLAEKSFSREDEREADRFGLELLFMEYGTVVGAPDFFAELPDIGSGAAGRLASFASTHPLSQDRIDAIHELAADRGWPETGELIPVRPFEGGVDEAGRLERHRE